MDLKTILLVKPGSLGDVVHALPCAAALKRHCPNARLSWVIDPRWAPILASNPFVDELVVFPRENFRGPGGLLRALSWFARHRGSRPDLAIDLQCLLRSALIARNATARHIIGLSDAREGARWLYHQTAPVQPHQHAIDRYLQVLPLLEIPIPAKPEFPLGPGEPVHTPLPDRFVVLHPFARGTGKSLSAAQVLKFVNELAPHPVIVAGIGEIPPALPANAINLTGRTSLGQLIWLLRRSAAVVSVDSGPMHIAAATGVPLLSIHTWSDPRRVGPYSDSAWIWQGGKIRPQSLAPGAEIFSEQPIDDKAIASIADWAREKPADSSDPPCRR